MPTTWRTLYIAGAIAIALSFLGLMAAIGVLIPPLVVIPLLYLIPVGLMLRFGEKRWPYIVGAALAALLLISYGPAIARDASHPDSFYTFAPVLSATLAAAVMTVSGIAGALRWRPDLARPVGLGAAAVLGVIVVGSLALQLMLQDDEQQQGDVYVEAREALYTSKVEGKAGRVAVFVENKDRVWHTFSIQELGLDVYIPASTNRRVEFEAKPGSYAYVCLVPEHEGMVGTIEVK